jgi:hypothetical protein
MTMRTLVSPSTSLRLAGAAALSFACALSARAQSNLSVQGFGYSAGQFSSRAQGTGGAIAESDPFSPVNPASIAVFPSRILFFQMEPEFRSVTSARGTERTSTARYPNVFGALPVGSNWVFSLGSSTLLDRTSTTSFRTRQLVSLIDTVPMTTTYQIDGAMNDVRLAVAWAPKPWARVGLGLHGITGRNLISLTQAFDDTVRFSSFAEQIIIGFKGSAVSTGFQLVSNSLSASGSARWGGSLSTSVGDTVLSRARVPNRFGAALAYTGIKNSVVSFRSAYTNWSALEGLGTPGLVAVDGWDTSLGADLAGPRISNRIIFIRGGLRTRTLPYEAAGKTVTENSISGGLGTTFGNGRVLTDFALIRSMRDANIDATERAWTLSFGISVRP